MSSVLYATALNIVYLLLWPLARRGMAKQVHRRSWAWDEETFASALTPGISMVVPAFNEETTVIESVRSILAQHYPTFELVIVDDGSTDGTVERLIEAYDLRPVVPRVRGVHEYKPATAMYMAAAEHDITVVCKPNGGRADALNCGLDVARHPMVCITDADSILDPDALRTISRPMLEDPDRVIAVGGTIRVANSCRIDAGRVVEARVPRRPLAAFQLVEYLRAFLLGRVAWERAGALIIVSGAFGLFRRDVLDAAGGYWTHTVGEDLEMTVRLHRMMREQGVDYRITYAADPICWTQVPDDVRSLGRQRRRWHRGLWESLWRHRRMFFRRRFGAVGWLALPYMLLFEFLGPLAQLAAWIATPIGLWLGLIDPVIVAMFVLCHALLGTLVTIIACSLEEGGYRHYTRRGDLVRMLTLALLENAGFRQLIDGYRLVGVWDMLRRERGWGGQITRRSFEGA